MLLRRGAGSPVKLTQHRHGVPSLGLAKVRWPAPGEEDEPQPPLLQRACARLREALPLDLSNLPRALSDECPPLQRGRQCSTPLKGKGCQLNRSGAFAEQALSPATAMQREQAHCCGVPSRNFSRVRLPGGEGDPQPPLLHRFFSPPEEMAAAPAAGGTVRLRSALSLQSLDLSSVSLELSDESPPLRRGRATVSNSLEPMLVPNDHGGLRLLQRS